MALDNSPKPVRSDSQFFERIIDSAFYGIANYIPIFDDGGKISDFKITYTNKEVPSHFGLAPKDVIGKSCHEVYPGIFENGVFAKMAETFETGEPGQYEVSIMENGKQVWLGATIEKSDESVTVTSKNVTAEKMSALAMEKLNAQLDEKNKELSSFTSIASHDLQEPLRKIQMFAGRILEMGEVKFADKSLSYFNNIISTAGRMQHLIDSLLAYSSMDSEDMVFRKTSLDKVLAEVMEMIDISEKNVTIEKKSLPSVRIVPVQFQQLLFNIVSNAIKYAKADGPHVIKIDAEKSEVEDKPYWKIVVSDNGIGFNPQYKDKIFEIFQRLHGKMEYSGSGVGLAICKKIADMHGGFIMAEGAPGQGAAFSIFIPAKD